MIQEAAGGIDPELRAEIDKALAPHRDEAMNEVSMFFGVDIRLLPREDLLALCFWIAKHARNHKEDQ